MAIYSHSRLSTFEQCPFKYKLRYIDKIRPEIEKTIEAHLGSAVHDTLEWIYNTIKENPNKNFDLDEIITHYAIKWQESYTNDILIVKKQLSSKDYFNKGVEFLANYFQENAPFKDGTIECEKKIFIEIDENTKVQGFIDRLVHNPSTNEYEIHDYKTANNLPSQEKINEDRQLALYSIAIKELYGKDKPVTLVWHYLAHNKKIKSKRTNLELEKLKQETKELIKKIESTKDFPFIPSILCNWCEYKSICPAHNPNSVHKTSINQTDMNNFPTAKKFIREYEKFENNNNNELDIW
jgi:putative RecB family exonuclease